ncbi:MAG: alpha-L-fucosidase, partial [Acidobacteriota bacterium]
MHRRKFTKLVATGAGLGSLSSASGIGRAAAIPGDSPTSFPVSDWDAVVKEGWGTFADRGGPGTWDGVPLQTPPDLRDPSGDGPFKAEWSSLLGYDAPEWYRDAKFGIWAHWSPQCVPEDGD